MNSFIKNRWAHFSISFYLSIKTYSLEGLMWSLNSNTLATWCEELTHWKRIWRWEGLKAGGEGDGREWDGWMASPAQQTWVWASSWSWWWTGRPGVLQSMGSQRVRLDWAAELNWKESSKYIPNTYLSRKSACIIESLWVPKSKF